MTMAVAIGAFGVRPGCAARASPALTVWKPQPLRHSGRRREKADEMAHFVLAGAQFLREQDSLQNNNTKGDSAIGAIFL